MESMVLTPRLACIASLVPPKARLADIGTDHGKLPLSLLLEGKIASAVASDIRVGPLEHAARNAAEHQIELPLRLGAGLEKIAPQECDTITIAGMGGQTIAEILTAAPWTADGEHLLLLQPMTMLYELRQWLWKRGFAIEREDICREERRFYVILSVRGGGERRHEPLSACAVTPSLLKAEGAGEYLAMLLRRETNALNGMRQARTEAHNLAEQEATVRAIKQALERL